MPGRPLPHRTTQPNRRSIDSSTHPSTPTAATGARRQAMVVAASLRWRRRRRWRRRLRIKVSAVAALAPLLLLALLPPLVVALAAAAAVNTDLPKHATAAFCYSRAPHGISMMAGSGRKQQQQQQQKAERRGPFSLRFPAWGDDNGGKKKRGGGRRGKQEAAAGGGFFSFGGLFGDGKRSSKRSSSSSNKTKANGKGGGGVGELFAGFLDFNSDWKDQLSLQRRIKKLEKEVAKDYVRGDRAKAAQYRYEVLRTLEEVNQSTMLPGALLTDNPRALELDRKDARELRRNAEMLRAAEAKKEAGRELLVKPEDLDSLLQQMEATLKDEQQWARLASACVGAAIGLAAVPSHDFFGVVAAALLTTFLTTRPGPVGDAARMSGFAVVSLFKAVSKLEQRFEVLRRISSLTYDALEASLPFPLPLLPREAPSWRNAYRGEGFLHPDLRPAPPLRDAQYVEYLREVKRWLEAEERAVLAALKKKEDDRIQDQLEREARRQQVEKALSGLWSLSSTIVGAAADGILRANKASGEEEEDVGVGVAPPPGLAEEGVEEDSALLSALGEGMEDDVEFLRRFRRLVRRRRLGLEDGEDEVEGEGKDDEEEHEEDLFRDDAQRIVDPSTGGGTGQLQGGGDSSSSSTTAEAWVYDGGAGGEGGFEGDSSEGGGALVGGGGGVVPMDSNGA